MEEKVMTPAIKGLVLSLVLILISLVVFFLGQTENKALGWIQITIFGVAIIWSCHYYTTQMKGNVTFGNVFAHGFKTSAATAAIVLVYTIIFIKFISPEMVDKALIKVKEKWEEQKLSAEQIKQYEITLRTYFIPYVVGMAMLMYLIGGAIFSLIGAAVSKKNADPTPFV